MEETEKNIKAKRWVDGAKETVEWQLTKPEITEEYETKLKHWLEVTKELEDSEGVGWKSTYTKEDLLDVAKYLRAENEWMLKILKRYRELFDCPSGHCERSVCSSDCQLCWDITNVLKKEQNDESAGQKSSRERDETVAKCYKLAREIIKIEKQEKEREK